MPYNFFMADVIKVPVKRKGFSQELKNDSASKEKIRVAVYTRVSTTHEDQISSIENQRKTLPEQVEADDRAVLAGIYEDYGITGTSTKNRESFRRMIKDAEEGKFDYIYCKNISRFARNLRSFIEYNHILQSLPKPVGVYFADEHMDTLDKSSTFVLSVLECVAEQESENTSQKIMSTFHTYYEKGIKVNASAPFGYDCVEIDGKRTLVPNSDAIYVKDIFHWYLDGYSTVSISKMLYEKSKGVISKRATSIAKILHNQTYVGDLVQGKQYTDRIKKKRKFTETELFVKPDAFEGIISREDFEEVQAMMDSLNRGYGAKPKTVFSGLIRCGRCGCNYVRHSARDGHAWSCGSFQRNYTGKNKVSCPGKTIKIVHEDTIIRLYLDAVRLLKSDVKHFGTLRYTKDQIALIQGYTEDITDFRENITSIVIGTKEKDKIFVINFDIGVSVTFSTVDKDTRYQNVEDILIEQEEDIWQSQSK